jgi:FkbM family methyltransferase
MREGESVRSVTKRAIQSWLGRRDLRVVKRSYLEWLERTRVDELDLWRIASMPGGHARELLQMLPDAKAQLRQDLFVLAQLDLRRGGTFVEFGATDGVDGNNTHLLEQHFGWTGILAEPARVWHPALRRNRPLTRIDTRCVWSTSGETLTFTETPEAYYSTIDRYRSGDLHHEKRCAGTSYEVETVSLVDLLRTHGAPRNIDYLSIDTEGSEYEILSHFDFERYRFRVITCEHNFTPMREALHALLVSHGYVRTLEEISSVDDWYVAAAQLDQPNR